MILEELYPCIDPCPNEPGIEGHGEGVKYKDKYYYYRVGRRIPKNKVSSLMYEGGYAGRVHGERDYIIVAWNGKAFVVLKVSGEGFIREDMKKFKNKSVEEAIEIVEEAERKQKEWRDSFPKCKHCGEFAFVLEDDQPNDVCSECHEKGKK